MSRATLWTTAGVCLFLAIVLTLLGVGDQAGALPNWQALVLGLVQGATELLPISSSGHLILVPWLGDWQYLKEHDAFNQTFDVALHLGTLVAVVAYFWRDIVLLVVAWFRTLRTRRIETGEERIAWFVVVATIPAAVVGLLGEDAIASNLGEPWQIAVALAVGALILWYADRQPQTEVDGATRPEGGGWNGACAEPRPDAGCFPLGDHDHRGAAAPARPRLGRPLLVPAARSDTFGAVLFKGDEATSCSRAARRVDGPIRRRHARPLGERADRQSPRSSATCAVTTTRSSSGTG